MASACLEFHDVLFYYDAASAPVFDGLSVQLPVGWTGIIGPREWRIRVC